MHARWAMLAVAGILVQVTPESDTLSYQLSNPRSSPMLQGRHAARFTASALEHGRYPGRHMTKPCTVQEIVRPDVFWYEAALKSPMPFGNSPAAILGLVAFELFSHALC